MAYMTVWLFLVYNFISQEPGGQVGVSRCAVFSQARCQGGSTATAQVCCKSTGPDLTKELRLWDLFICIYTLAPLQKDKYIWTFTLQPSHKDLNIRTFTLEHSNCDLPNKT